MSASHHLTKDATRCVDCFKPAVVTCHRFANGRIRFRVTCDACGGFSHYIAVGRALERAVEEMVIAVTPGPHTPECA